MKECNEIVDCPSRREFLVKTAMLAGGLVLTISGVSKLSAAAAAFSDVTVVIDDSSPLNKVGGSAMVDSTAGKIAIVRTGDASFVAFSVKCTHKGFPVDYDTAKKQFYCSKHGSIFDGTTGAATHGPADEPLQSYPAKGTAKSVTVTLA